jgi:two-component system sensor histidine kinase DctS
MSQVPAAPWRWIGRRGLWAALALLVVALQALLVWLAWRYEVGATQRALEATNLRVVADLRLRLSRLAQAAQALPWDRLDAEPGLAHSSEGGAWSREAALVLRAFPEARRLTRLSLELQPAATAETPYDEAPPAAESRSSELRIACANAQRLLVPAYSPSFFVSRRAGNGQEHVLACLPHLSNARLSGYTVLHISLPQLLAEGVAAGDAVAMDIGLTEADGTRLARLPGPPVRGGGVFVSRQLLELPGWGAMLRMESTRAAPRLLPSFLTAAVLGLSLALAGVLALLLRDARRRAAADRALAEALAFRQAMDESLETGMRARDLQGRVTYVNPAFCRMVGWDQSDLVGQMPPYPYWQPGSREQHERRLADVLAGKASRTGFESVWQRRNGETFPVLLIEAPLIDADQRHTGWMSAVVDLSEQRRAEELSRQTQDKLQATSRLAAVGEMASTLSHELNQPLAAIASYAHGSLNLVQDAQGQAAVPQDVAFALQRIAEQAERAGRVIRSVQDFVRRRESSRQAVAVQALFDAVMPLVRLQARAIDAQVEVAIESGLREVQADRTMIEQVVLNLARNGLQAMSHPDAASAPRRLVLRAEKAQASGWVEISVTDGGVGIDPDTASRLFTPFFSTKSEGMGLGLNLCRTVVEQHGGALTFEPGPGGVGTRFRFTLPAATPLVPRHALA